jgi:epsilon-lactone hydrolase
MSADPVLGKLIELLRERRLPTDTPVAEQRAAMELAVSKVPLAEGVSISTGSLAGRPVEWFEPPNRRGDGVVLHFHGGGYVMGSLVTIRAMATYLAAASGARVVTLDYRLAPEHPYPAAVADAVAAYAELLDRHDIDPNDLVFSGDSAGGGLVLAALLAVRDRGMPLPAAGVCISPWADLTLPEGSLDTNADRDPQVTRAALTIMAEHYLAGADPTDPGASPRYADLSGLPPLLIQVGGAEGLLDDSIAVADQARAAGVEVTLDVWPEMIHVWHAFAPRLGPAMDGWERIAEWMDQQWSRRDR